MMIENMSDGSTHLEHHFILGLTLSIDIDQKPYIKN